MGRASTRLDNLGEESAKTAGIAITPRRPGLAAVAVHPAANTFALNVTWTPDAAFDNYRVCYGHTVGGPYNGVGTQEGPSPVPAASSPFDLHGLGEPQQAPTYVTVTGPAIRPTAASTS